MMINQYNQLPYDEQNRSLDKLKKILLLSDDIRMQSGVSNQSRELILGTVHKYRWVNLAGSISHPEKGKVVDMCAATTAITGVKDTYVRLYPTDGYGNEDILFMVLAAEKPDAIMHFTDPRFFGWLYALERQIRKTIPLTYYNIWDSTPNPYYNRAFYGSCDSLFSISRQTYNINKWVMNPENCMTMDGVFDTHGSFIPFETKEIK